jgi:hypothetical protein
MAIYKRIVKVISNILHNWDPIGCNPPEDEYDDLAIKLFGRIKKGDSKEQLVDYLDKYLKGMMGLKNVPIQEEENSISRILEEYKKQMESSDN